MKVLCALALPLLLLACTDPITVGSELLVTDRATVGEITDIPFTTRVVTEDSLLAYDGTVSYVPPSPFTFGSLQDPEFGTTRHGVYLTPRLPRNASQLPVVPPYARLVNVTIDSAVVILPIDTVRGFYGPGREFPVRATQISEAVSFTERFYNTIFLPTGQTNVAANATFSATATPTLVRDTAITKPELLRPHARIRLSDDFARQIGALGPENYAFDSTFRDAFAGLYLAPDGPSNSLVTFAPTEGQNETPYSGFNFYYRDSTGRAAVYRIGFLQALPANSYDFDGSLAGTLLDSTTSNTLVAVAGQSGLMTEINLGDISELRGRVINRAELEIPVADVEGVSYTDYPLPTRLELFYRATPDGPLLSIADRLELARTRAIPANILFFMGGQLRTEDNIRLYSPAFSIHLQRILDGEAPPQLYLRVSPLDNTEVRAARAFLNGPAAATNPARIRVTYTDLD
ncbi:DUF4270 family protein [Lewinella sp. IMCC34183]|uniref:DUF4270 family protein n=1 Tax=Lewinella sp. IMCC34183 TaxID=2248762 RepID=UPI000E253701|nr:DUF4270 family protein [Lewinella sp. IMCC34183]